MATSSTYLQLPEDFTPSDTEIVIGRGKKVIHHSGNERFRETIQDHLEEYNAAATKAAKSVILVRVLSQVRSQSPVGAFVKYDSKTKRWYALEEAAARINCAQAFRDASASHYRSSKQFKQKKRWDIKTAKQQQHSKKKQDHPFSKKLLKTVPEAAPSSSSLSAIKSSKSFQPLGKSPLSYMGLGSNRSSSTPVAQVDPKNMNMGHLAGILDSAMAVIEPDDFLSDDDDGVPQFPPSVVSHPKQSPSQQASQTPTDLSNLLHVFEQQVEFTQNPYEPKPINSVGAPVTPDAETEDEAQEPLQWGTFWPTTGAPVPEKQRSSQLQQQCTLNHKQESSFSLRELLSQIY